MQNAAHPLRQAFIGLCIAMGAAWPTLGQCAVEIEGVSFEERIEEAGHTLVLNGVGMIKRSYFKAEVVGLYVPTRTQDPEQIYKANRPTVVKRVILRDFSMSAAIRNFLDDFKRYSTEQEFRQVIPQVSSMGAAYGKIPKVLKGDRIDVVWLPPGTMYGRINGKLLDPVSEANETGVKTDRASNELFFRIFMRSFIGENASDDLRKGMLGLK